MLKIPHSFSDLIVNDPTFVTVSEVAGEQGLETYIVGGYVRDLLMERESKDVDFVCVGSGVKLARAVQRKIKKSSLTVYKNFGTAQVKTGSLELEFVGARKESYQRHSRKPIVEDGTLKDDQKRRDFTINSLAIGLTGENYGKLIDPFDGVKHIRQKIIKTPLDPDITFSDDPLRILRAIRFATQLNFDIAVETTAAITSNINRLSIVSKERITDELNKIILSPVPSYGFKLLYHTGVLQAIFPEMTALQGVETRDGKSHKDNFYHTLQVLDNVAKHSENLWLRWSALLHDIAKPATKRFNTRAGWTFHGHEDRGAKMVPHIFKRLKLPLNEKMSYVQKMVRLHLRPIALVKEDITDSALRRLLFEAGEDIDDLMLLCRADITSKNDNKVRRYLSNFDKVEKKLKEVEENDSLKNFQPPISGELIMSTFGLPQSREIGMIKDEIREAILDGKIHNEFDVAYDLMLQIGEKKGLTVKNKHNNEK
jgi:tRNA nucleotidyltransferase/poly(A) polymerase